MSTYDTTRRYARRATEQAALRALPRNVSQKRRKALAACTLKAVRSLDLTELQIYTLAALCSMTLPEEAQRAAKFALAAEALVKPREGKQTRKFVADVVGQKMWCVYTAR